MRVSLFYQKIFSHTIKIFNLILWPVVILKQMYKSFRYLQYFVEKFKLYQKSQLLNANII